MSCGGPAKMSRLGVSSGTSLLVHQWDDLSRRGSKGLAEEDENMSAVQSIPNRRVTDKIDLRGVDTRCPPLALATHELLKYCLQTHFPAVLKSMV